ncbi:ABC transporter ATP-binding protein [Lederbergia graminis]|uniref:ABC transporter ATP-binding protein n=1 Tax=Lederbergia graminis TaxID=735518 RepID=A0ABW0LI35_9BACI|nr:ABC transporter ATP-binding protein [Paenibacillus bovis]HLU23290.1 ABC transporter ATP-binding protein [Bacillaceae bacterium]
MEPIIKVENVVKSFNQGSKKIDVLDGINMSIEANQLIALRGRSGSGKTTLLNLLGALDRPTSGDIYFDGNHINKMNEKQRSELRRTEMGFVFQSYGLVPLMSVEENVEFGLRIAGVPRSEWKEKIAESIELVGLSKRKKHRPFELSGGEQQRVAIARAIASKPKVILADEPTAELDSKMAFRIIHAFQEIVKNSSTTIIMTTHDPGILEILDHVYTLEDKNIAYRKQEIIV